MSRKRSFSTTKREISRLSGGKRERALRLLEKAQFMDQELKDLQATIQEEGWTEEYQNGANQSGVKKSSAGEVYLNLVKNYLAVVKQLNDMLETVPDEINEIENEFFK